MFYEFYYLNRAVQSLVRILPDKDDSRVRLITETNHIIMVFRGHVILPVTFGDPAPFGAMPRPIRGEH